jgi:hypothetical protein
MFNFAPKAQKNDIYDAEESKDFPPPFGFNAGTAMGMYEEERQMLYESMWEMYVVRSKPHMKGFRGPEKRNIALLWNSILIIFIYQAASSKNSCGS